jgi:hypothetical protein
MKSTLTAVFLLLPALACAGNLLDLGITDEGHQLIIDVATARKSGGSLIRIWGLENLATPNAGGAQSIRRHVQVDCASGQFRRLQEMQFSEPNGKGQRLPDDGRPDTVWNTATTGSAYDHLVARVCKL